jgi:hypothetical protein
MPFTQIIDYDDATPITFRKFKKTVHNGIEWEDKIFYEIKENVNRAAMWLHEKYGHQVYCKTWWQTHTSVCMSEMIYTHYALSVL